MCKVLNIITTFLLLNPLFIVDASSMNKVQSLTDSSPDRVTKYSKGLRGLFYEYEGDTISNDTDDIEEPISDYTITIPDTANMSFNLDEIRTKLALLQGDSLLESKFGDFFKSLNVGDILIETVERNRLLRRQIGRERVLEDETVSTEIKVTGGSATFYGHEHTLLESLQEQSLDNIVFSNLSAALSEFFDGKLVSVTLTPGGSEEVAPPATEPATEPTPEFGGGSGPITESKVISDGDNVIVESGSSNSLPIVFSVLSVVAVVGASIMFVKKRRSGRREFTEYDSQDGGDFEPRNMKRDLDFEQYVVECCTDNDIFDEDDHFFATQQVPKQHREIS